MPFLEYFGFKTYPFSLTPDASLYYPSAESEGILSSLQFVLMRGDGLVKVVGEVGSGKTLLCRLLLKRLDEAKTNLAYINAPTGLDDVKAITNALINEFAVPVKRCKKEPFDALRDYLIEQHRAGKRSILVIDEAQALGAAGLEAVRLLSNLETETDKLLQIVLFGQPELDKLLHRPALRQVLQRVQFGFHLHPFPEERVSGYIRFRIAQTLHIPKRKAKGPSVVPSVAFTDKASALIANASRGLPRLVNVLADKALIAAYAKDTRVVDCQHVRLACKETEGIAFPYSLAKWFF